jgi:hypothetical protein
VRRPTKDGTMKDSGSYRVRQHQGQSRPVPRRGVTDHKPRPQAADLDERPA